MNFFVGFDVINNNERIIVWIYIFLIIDIRYLLKCMFRDRNIWKFYREEFVEYWMRKKYLLIYKI